MFQIEQYPGAGAFIVSSTRVAPCLSNPRWRSRVRPITASSSGWPGQTNAASGCPGGATRDFSKAMRSYARATGFPAPVRGSRLWTAGGTRAIWYRFGSRSFIAPPNCSNASRKKALMKCGCRRRTSARSISALMRRTSLSSMTACASAWSFSRSWSLS